MKALRAIGSTTMMPLMLTCLLVLGGCATTSPVTKTNGAVTDLMMDDNYEAVRSGSPAVREWARKALHYVNDLSYELKREIEK